MNPFPDGYSATDLMGSIASSTSSYIGDFAPVFEVMAGIILAMALVAFLVSLFAHRSGGEGINIDDTIMPV
jgi:hypothetical protein